MPSLVWNRAKLARFKRLYAEHSATPSATFEFEGHGFVVGYAKYLIEYLEQELAP